MGGFEVYPAIDVAGGRRARLVDGEVRWLPGDPIEAARAYVADGAGWIHLVDLDAALTGEAGSLGMIEQVAALGVRVQAGGGLSEAGVSRALERGAARAVLGAAALGDPEAPARAVARHGERVGVGIDVRGDVVAPRGGVELGPPVAAVLRHLAKIQPAFVVFTNVERDGRMSGPDVEGLSRVAGAIGSPVVASGGIRSIEDLVAVAALEGVAGAIVGRALEEGAFSLTDALAVLGD